MDLNIGHQIKKLRTQQGLTQEYIATKIGVSYQAVSKWENGVTTPDISLLPILAALFGVRIDDLFRINREDEFERIDRILYNETLTDDNYFYAKQILDNALEENDCDVEVIKRYAELYAQRIAAEARAARKMLENGMINAPNDMELFSLYRRLCGGVRQVVKSSNELFISVCAPYAEKDPENYKLYEMLIEATIDNRDFEKADMLMSKVKYTEENKNMLTVFCGDILAAKGDYSKALELWRSVPDTDSKGQYEIGERFYSVHNYEDAIRSFNNSFNSSSYPRDLSAIYSLAFLYEKLERYKDAADAWDTIICVLSNDHGITEGETVDWAKREAQAMKNKIR